MNADRRVNGCDWEQVTHVLVDMDGTLLDRHFDNFFFEEELPRRYAKKHGLGEDDAKARLFRLYRAVEGELQWTDLHYWTRILDIDRGSGMAEAYTSFLRTIPMAAELLDGADGARMRSEDLRTADGTW